MFSCEIREGAVIQDKDGDCLAAVDLVGELRLGEEAVVLAVLLEPRENVGDVVAGGDGEEREEDKESSK